jgi:hypothetical protein
MTILIVKFLRHDYYVEFETLQILWLSNLALTIICSDMVLICLEKSGLCL